MKFLHALLGVVLLCIVGKPAEAAVTYELNGAVLIFPLGFNYETDQFIKTNTTVDGKVTDYCGVLFLSCASLAFTPNVTVNGTAYDSVSMNFDGPPPIEFLFDAGDLGKAGTYTSVFGFGGELPAMATLTVSQTSTVPLPASAPLFGAALLSLGMIGARRSLRAKAEG